MSTYISISEARANLPNLINEIGESRIDEVYITVNGKPKAVVMSIEELESIRETAEILAIPGARESIAEGLTQAKRGEGITLEELLKKYS